MTHLYTQSVTYSKNAELDSVRRFNLTFKSVT